VLSRETIKAAVTGLGAMSVLLAMVIVGSRNLQYFDTALFAYLFATIFAFFGFAYCYSMWLQRQLARQLQVWATEHNHRTIRFYRSAKFQITETRQPNNLDYTLNKLLLSLNLSKVGQPGAIY